jgi:hypothetical protein
MDDYIEDQCGLYIKYTRKTIEYNITLIPLTIIPLTVNSYHIHVSLLFL